MKRRIQIKPLDINLFDAFNNKDRKSFLCDYNERKYTISISLLNVFSLVVFTITGYAMSEVLCVSLPLPLSPLFLSLSHLCLSPRFVIFANDVESCLVCIRDTHSLFNVSHSFLTAFKRRKCVYNSFFSVNLSTYN